MKANTRSFIKGLLAFHLFGIACFGAEPATSNGNARIVFIGDSITGQGGGWLGAGYVFKMREALSALYPEGKHDLVPLGGSGMGVSAWLSLSKDEARQKHDLDVKGVEVAAALSKPADVMVVMLGMNDVLAPYVNDADASLDQWLANYRELVSVLSARLKPKIIALATITPQTEDPATPMNRVLARMNQRITTLAAELKANVVPTNATYWDVLAEGRKTQADFTLAGDRIHPNPPGHVAVAMAMLKGLDEDKAAAWLREERLAKALSTLKPVPAPTVPPACALPICVPGMTSLPMPTSRPTPSTSPSNAAKISPKLPPKKAAHRRSGERSNPASISPTAPIPAAWTSQASPSSRTSRPATVHAGFTATPRAASSSTSKPRASVLRSISRPGSMVSDFTPISSTKSRSVRPPAKSICAQAGTC